MAKLIRTYVAQLMDVVPASEEIEDNWSWRREYIEMEGTLFILESEYKHIHMKKLIAIILALITALLITPNRGADQPPVAVVNPPQTAIVD